MHRHELFDEFDEKPRSGDVSLAVLLSIALHLTALSWLAIQYYRTPVEGEQPSARYVQLVPATSAPPEQNFVEAPGPKTDRRNPEAALSNADRRASTPHPTGERPTMRPGPGQGIYDGGPRGERPQPQERMAPPTPPGAEQQAPQDQSQEGIQPYRAGATPQVDWRAAIKDAGAQSGARARSAPMIGDWSAGGNLGGEEGSAETGPLSFETQWYDWGDYAAGMVAKIRYHWYGNMPALIRTGLEGVVTIRFSIQRDGRITDVEMISSSGIPPYDNSARRAIELASPLAPLPATFPKDHERVTARFFYNKRVE